MTENLNSKEVKEINVQQLKQLRDDKEEHVLIDVRNPNEFEFCNLQGVLLPMSQITEKFSEIPKDKKVIVHCHHGGRSKKVIQWLQDQHNYDNLFNLAGGIHAWSLEIDSEVPVY